MKKIPAWAQAGKPVWIYTYQITGNEYVQTRVVDTIGETVTVAEDYRLFVFDGDRGHNVEMGYNGPLDGFVLNRRGARAWVGYPHLIPEEQGVYLQAVREARDRISADVRAREGVRH